MEIRGLSKKIQYVSFDDEIDVYWDKTFGLEEKEAYEIFLDGRRIASSNFTHFEFDSLKANTEYSIKVISYLCDKKEVCTLYEEIKVRTKEKKQRIDITKTPFNAVGDGFTDNTKAIQAALNNCQANQKVIIPEGIFLCGALTLPSHTELYIEKKGVLLGTARREGYLPKRFSRFEGYSLQRYSALINVGEYDTSGTINAQEVVIRGEGEIRGGGLELANDVIAYERTQTTEGSDEKLPARLRPFLIDANNCQDLVVSGLKVGNGSAWNVHFAYCKNVVISRCQITSHGIWNGDGIDPDSSENIAIYDVKLDTGDDGIAIKSGKNPEGNIVNIPCKDIKIFHITATQGIAVGSELSGGIENVFIWDVGIGNSSRGIKIKTTAERGGHVRDYYLSNVVCPYVLVSTNYSCNNDGEGADTLTKIEDLYFEHVVSTCQSGEFNFPSGFDINGFEREHVKNVVVKNVKLTPKKDNKETKVSFRNVDGLDVQSLTIEK